jgi:uncharacterized membrane protein YuzA (DUF378 family)
MSAFSRLIYTLIGLGGIYLAFGARSFASRERESEPMIATRQPAR